MARSASRSSRCSIAVAMQSREEARLSITGPAPLRARRTGSAGSSREPITTPVAAPTRPSRARVKSKLSSGGWRATTSTAEAAAWEASRGPPPTRIAANMASATVTPICQVPVPICATSRSAMAMPTATPMASSMARCRRSPIVRPSVTTAAMGAKKGLWWPSTSRAMSHASEAATAVWRIGRAAATARSRRVRSPSREASAASSSNSLRTGARAMS